MSGKDISKVQVSAKNLKMS